MRIVVSDGQVRMRTSLKKIYVALQAVLVLVNYRLHFRLAHSRQRIAWVAREKIKLVRSHDFLLSSGWLKQTAGAAAEVGSQSFHLCNISAYLSEGQDLYYCGKLINWVTGLSVLRRGAFPSAHIVFAPGSFERPLAHPDIRVAEPYDSNFIEDIRVFDSFGCLWGTGSVRNLKEDRTRPVVIQFEAPARALKPARVIVLDENVLDKKLPLHQIEKNWTPVPFSPGEIHFIQDHAKGNIVSLHTKMFRAEVLQPRGGRAGSQNQKSEPGRSTFGFRVALSEFQEAMPISFWLWGIPSLKVRSIVEF